MGTLAPRKSPSIESQPGRRPPRSSRRDPQHPEAEPNRDFTEVVRVARPVPQTDVAEATRARAAVVAQLLVGDPLDDDGCDGDGRSDDVEDSERWACRHQRGVERQTAGDDERHREEMKREQAHGPEGLARLLAKVGVLPIFVFEAGPAPQPVEGEAKAIERDDGEHDDLPCIELSRSARTEREPERDGDGRERPVRIVDGGVVEHDGEGEEHEGGGQLGGQELEQRVPLGRASVHGKGGCSQRGGVADEEHEVPLPRRSFDDGDTHARLHSRRLFPQRKKSAVPGAG